MINIGNMLPEPNLKPLILKKADVSIFESLKKQFLLFLHKRKTLAEGLLH